MMDIKVLLLSFGKKIYGDLINKLRDIYNETH
jgi:hypothetical protein